MAQKRTYNQMMLPFDLAELRKPAPVTPVARAQPVATDVPAIPKGLRELVASESLSPERVQRLLAVAAILADAKTVLIYNDLFDVSCLRQTCRLHRVEEFSFDHACIMRWYARFYGEWQRGHVATSRGAWAENLSAHCDGDAMTVIHVMENEGEVIDACPFCECGGDTLGVYQQGVQKFLVGCDNCGAEGRRGFSIREAIDIWNQVAGVPLDDLVSVVARYTFQVERGNDKTLDRVTPTIRRTLGSILGKRIVVEVVAAEQERVTE